MRVLLNTKPLVLFDKSGVGYYALNIYRELLKSGVDIAPTLDTGSQTLINSLSKLSSRLRSVLGRWYPSFIIQFGDALIGRLSRKDETRLPFDIYHETSLDPLPAVSARIVCNLYDLSFLRFPQFFVKEFAQYVSANVKKNVLSAERIIVNTVFIKNEAMELLHIPEDRIDVIPLAPAALYHPLDRNAERPEEVFRFTNKDYILYVGTVEPRKNLKVLIRAFKDIKARHDLSLILAGKLGWLYDDIVSYPETLGIKDEVIFTNYIKEETILALYNHARVFVYPSSYEGFGMPPLEAMSCGTPVIISDIPPLKEVAGDAALSFNPGDSKELAGVMDKVISSESLRHEMSQKGLERAKEYSWGKAAELTVRTYARALEK